MLTLFSPAKLNLFFRVIQKRPDGFHEIASLFQAIDLGDTLSIQLADGEDHLTCTDPSLPTDKTNLILRAADLFREKTGLSNHFAFKLEKNIPKEAGLGGGSSNAATTLWGLNQLLKTKIDDQTLAAWGSELGSDIPFFFSQGTTYCEGRGEILTPVSLPASKVYWLAKPQEGLSTPKVFQTTRVDRLSSRDPKVTLSQNLQGQETYYNDLEEAAFTLMPSLTTLKSNLLNLGFSSVHMTGSGTTFFCLGIPKDTALPGVQFFQVNTTERVNNRWYTGT